MEIKEYQIKKELVVTKLKCSCCKKEYKYNTDYSEIQEFVQIYNSCGYKSIFEDGKYYRLDLCQYCVKKLLEPYIEFQKEDSEDS